MVFSDTTTKQGIIEDIDFNCDSDTNTYPVADKTRNVNRAMDKAVSLIFDSDGIWEWDDSNQTDLPIATTSLVSSQADYSFAVTHLKITRVMVKNSSGKWQIVQPFDITEDASLTFLQDNNNVGTPMMYDKRANSIFLSPTPNYASSGGLKIYFQRPSTYFTVADTTKEPGFAAIFHRYLSLCASYDFCAVKGLPKASQFKNDIKEMETAIQKFYGKRNRDDRLGLKAKQRDYE